MMTSEAAQGGCKGPWPLLQAEIHDVLQRASVDNLAETRRLSAQWLKRLRHLPQSDSATSIREDGALHQRVCPRRERRHQVVCSRDPQRRSTSTAGVRASLFVAGPAVPRSRKRNMEEGATGRIDRRRRPAIGGRYFEDRDDTVPTRGFDDSTRMPWPLRPAYGVDAMYLALGARLKRD